MTKECVTAYNGMILPPYWFVAVGVVLRCAVKTYCIHMWHQLIKPQGYIRPPGSDVKLEQLIDRMNNQMLITTYILYGQVVLSYGCFIILLIFIFMDSEGSPWVQYTNLCASVIYSPIGSTVIQLGATRAVFDYRYDYLNIYSIQCHIGSQIQIGGRVGILDSLTVTGNTCTVVLKVDNDSMGLSFSNKEEIIEIKFADIERFRKQTPRNVVW